MLTIFYSNKLEALAIKLGALIKIDPLPPLVREQVVVESSAMMQWLQRQLAEQNGIAANMVFPYPASLVWQIYREQMPELPKHTCFDRNPLVWRIFDQLIRLRVDQNPNPGLIELKQFAGQLSNEHQLMTFAQLVADLYDQYQIYRPEWLHNWRNGGQEGAEASAWQAELWRVLCGLSPDEPDRASVYFDAFAHFPLSNDQTLRIAPRLHFFAVSTLPEAYMRLFDALAQTMDIYLYVLNPCAQYWGDIKPYRLVMQGKVEGRGGIETDESDEIGGSNELLALLARQSRDFVHLLQDLDAIDHPFFVESQGDSLLAKLQNDVLLLKQHLPGSDDEHKTLLTQAQANLEVHRCHSALREVQVLHDQLLHYFNEHTDVPFDQVAVMVPNLETYTPYILSVFETADETLRLPFHIAQKQGLEGEPVKNALLDILQLPASRFSRSAVLRLIEEPVIARRFGITEFSTVKQLVEDLNVRFGLHDKDWNKYGDNIVSLSWQQAHRRLLESYAMADESISGLIDGIDGDAADEAGRLCELVEALSLLEAEQGSRTVTGWCDLVDTVLLRFFNAQEDAEHLEIQQVHQALQSLKETAELAAFDTDIEHRVFLDRFQNALTQAVSHHYFRPGCINIATLLPMRSIPFQRICVLGLNDGAFPTPSTNNQLDLMLHTPKRGDRSVRDEERYLFLESLLASRESFYLSFVGRSHIDNTERFPSLLVTELLNHLDDGYLIDGEVPSQCLVQDHQLQPFHPAYFDGVHPNIQSFHPEHWRQAEILNQGSSDELPAFGEADRETSELPAEITLTELIRAIVQPHRDYLDQLGVELTGDELEDEDNELFLSGPLENYQLLETSVTHLLTNEQMPGSEVLSQQGVLPLSAVGDLALEHNVSMATKILEQASNAGIDLISLSDTQTVPVEVTVGATDIAGVLTNIAELPTSAKRIGWVGRKLHGRHALKAWVEHLVCHLVLDKKVTSYLFDEKASLLLTPLSQSDARDALQSLISRLPETRQSPSWFFAKAGFEYQRELEKGDETKARKKLETGILGTSQFGGEWHDLFTHYALRGVDALPINEAEKEARSVFAPLVACLKDAAEGDDANA